MKEMLLHVLFLQLRRNMSLTAQVYSGRAKRKCMQMFHCGNAGSLPAVGLFSIIFNFFFERPVGKLSIMR